MAPAPEYRYKERVYCYAVLAWVTRLARTFTVVITSRDLWMDWLPRDPKQANLPPFQVFWTGSARCWALRRSPVTRTRQLTSTRVLMPVVCHWFNEMSRVGSCFSVAVSLKLSESLWIVLTSQGGLASLVSWAVIKNVWQIQKKKTQKIQTSP